MICTRNSITTGRLIFLTSCKNDIAGPDLERNIILLENLPTIFDSNTMDANFHLNFDSN